MEFKLSKNANILLKKRYLRKDKEGNIIETPEEMFRRVAKNIASADKKYGKKNTKETEDEFFNIMKKLEFLPNSPTLMNSGTNLQQLAACFVLPINDSIDSIFEAIKNAALIHKSGGGTGFNFSEIRSKGDIVKTTKGIASGPVSFMKVFDAATQAIKQGGRRRGANMGVLQVEHPDIIEFIKSKKKKRVLTNFNLSVAVDEVFMKALTKNQKYSLINKRTNKVVKKVEATKIFKLIVDMAWETGEPGMLFLDHINNNNPIPGLGKINCTNPCGEQPLLPYEACNLGSINLSKMIKKQSIDFEKLGKTVDIAVKFLDNAIDKSKFPLNKINKVVKNNRKIGLGVMGFADLLTILRIPYDSENALKIAEQIMSFISKRAEKRSSSLALKRGSFPSHNKSIYNFPMRNATLTTIAPTGSISLIADCSSGIEPLYGLSFVRKVLNGKKFTEINNNFLDLAKKQGFYSNSLKEKIKREGSVENIKEVPEKVKEVFKTAYLVPPEQHVKMQAAFQKYTDNSVSKTVNLPENISRDKVKQIFLIAYNLKCKGITIYRNKSRKNQTYTTDNICYECR